MTLRYRSVLRTPEPEEKLKQSMTNSIEEARRWASAVLRLSPNGSHVEIWQQIENLAEVIHPEV